MEGSPPPSHGRVLGQDIEALLQRPCFPRPSRNSRHRENPKASNVCEDSKIRCKKRKLLCGGVHGRGRWSRNEPVTEGRHALSSMHACMQHTKPYPDCAQAFGVSPLRVVRARRGINHCRRTTDYAVLEVSYFMTLDGLSSSQDRPSEFYFGSE